ncbi:MAG: MotA/TolQ/ExbB proton channel family protein [Acidobacteriota bacterium]|nr:MotA/TolQ/ExbB proton channel family protein [Acidobacteriota bacterium]
MKRKSITWILFVGALVLTALTYAMVGYVFRTSGAYAFLFSRGLYQPISLTFFFFGLLLVGHRWLLFREERTIVEIEIPDGTITPANAKEFSTALQAKHGSSILGRRLAALLQGSARHEEIGPLEERLKARDRDELDQSAALVGWVRSLPPLVGLLGTLDGLRGGIAEISMINNANDLDALRGRLQLFAQHASTAFDTTLLGISAAAVLSAAIFLVRKTEDSYLAQVDTIADALARRMPHFSELEGQISEAVSGIIAGVADQFRALMQTATAPLVQEFSKQLGGGVSDAVHGWLDAWQRELRRTSETVLQEVQEKSHTNAAVLEGILLNGVGEIRREVSGLEQTVSRPRPVQIRISGEAELERSAHGD